MPSQDILTDKHFIHFNSVIKRKDVNRGIAAPPYPGPGRLQRKRNRGLTYCRIYLKLIRSVKKEENSWREENF